jgi:hypothetical protein
MEALPHLKQSSHFLHHKALMLQQNSIRIGLCEITVMRTDFMPRMEFFLTTNLQGEVKLL